MPVLVKQVATVIKEFKHGKPPDSGYLAAEKGEEVQVLYVGSSQTDDEGWIYAERRLLTTGRSDKQGWLPSDSVKGEKLDFVACKSATTPRDPDLGYLECKPPQLLKVLHWGDDAASKDWIYAEAGQLRGWIALSKVAAPEEVQQTTEGRHASRFPHWRTVQQKTRLLPFANVPEEDRDKYGGYGSAEGGEKWSVPVGRCVEVLAFADHWAQVKMPDGTRGWVERNVLSSEKKEAPPPPPAEPHPATSSRNDMPPRPTRKVQPPPSQRREESVRRKPAEVHYSPVPEPGVPASTEDSPAASSGPKASAKPARRPPPSAVLAKHCAAEAQTCKPPGQGRSPPPPPPPPPPPKAAKAAPAAASSSVAANVAVAGIGVAGTWQPHQAVPKQPAPSQEKVIELLTFGLENLDSVLYDRCREHPGGGAACQVPDSELIEILRTGRHEDVDIVVDARMFPDPDAFSLTRHSGRHYKIVQRLCQHRNFPSWLQSVALKFRKVQEARRNSTCKDNWTKSITIAVYCRAGKHRSVAAAGILKHIFEATGYRCPEARHLSYDKWGRNCCKGQCKECLEPPPELQDTLREALQRWKMICI
eukprot:TRINITY_DN21348_c0_g1_i1.p1 TRINITY_DN21348_c0_g1~~TRINITY_DN21348_c0_g1_i1.p1  ORF type:complete len:589 (-),score=109.82 TRINITY_DN21348_c0_g1_i1:127-1893(-)